MPAFRASDTGIRLGLGRAVVGPLRIDESTRLEDLPVAGVRLQDRLGGSGRTRGPRHEGHVDVKARGIPQACQPVATEKRSRTDDLEQPIHLAGGLAGVDRHEHRASQPGPKHAGRHAGCVR